MKQYTRIVWMLFGERFIAFYGQNFSMTDILELRDKLERTDGA
jgi:hypothetical protein